MSIIIAPEAARDLSEIYDYIAGDRPSAALRVLAQLNTAFQRLADGELKGQEVRLLDGSRAQAWPVPPYRIYYQRVGDETHIFRVYHQARRSIEA
jgi:plasmid stabilization system protein ParE